MAEKITLPEDEDELAQIYNETLEHHQTYLERLHAAFDRRCDEIGVKTKKKLEKIDDTDEEAKQQILMEEKELLDKTLAELKFAINKSNNNAMKKLEEIQEKIDSMQMNIDAELAAVEQNLDLSK